MNCLSPDLPKLREYAEKQAQARYALWPPHLRRSGRLGVRRAGEAYTIEDCSFEQHRARDGMIDAELALLCDLTRPESRDAVARLVATRLWEKPPESWQVPYLLPERYGRRNGWCMGGWDHETSWTFTDDTAFIAIFDFRATLIPEIASATNAMEAIALIATHVLGSPGAR